MQKSFIRKKKKRMQSINSKFRRKLKNVRTIIVFRARVVVKLKLRIVQRFNKPWRFDHNRHPTFEEAALLVIMSHQDCERGI